LDQAAMCRVPHEAAGVVCDGNRWDCRRGVRRIPAGRESVLTTKGTKSTKSTKGTKGTKGTKQEQRTRHQEQSTKSNFVLRSLFLALCSCFVPFVLFVPFVVT
jgi:hypothetical protein